MDKIYNKFTGIGWASKISKFKETKNGNKYITFNFVLFDPSNTDAAKWPAPIVVYLFENSNNNLDNLNLKENSLVQIEGKINSYFFRRKTEISIWATSLNELKI